MAEFLGEICFPQSSGHLDSKKKKRPNTKTGRGLLKLAAVSRIRFNFLQKPVRYAFSYFVFACENLKQSDLTYKSNHFLCGQLEPLELNLLSQVFISFYQKESHIEL